MANDTLNNVESQLLLRSGSVIIGTQGDDSLTGTASDDVIVGLGGDDDIRALDGDDFIDGGPGDDFFLGGAGNDTIDYSALNAPIILRPRGVVLNGAPSLDDPAAAGLQRVLDSGSVAGEFVFADVERVSNGGLSAQGLAAAGPENALPAVPEKDLLVGIERIVGAEGQPNVIDARADPGQFQTSGLDVNLGDSSLTVFIPTIGSLSFEVENFTVVFGTTNTDAIVGSDRSDRLSGEGGNDFIAGLGGDDVLDGGSGRDALSGGDGNDVLNGGSARDSLEGGGGDDVLSGGDDGDVLFGGNRRERRHRRGRRL